MDKINSLAGNQEYRDNTHEPVRDGLDDEALFKTLQDWYRIDQSHSNEWRTQAAKDFSFVAGEQWDPSDKRHLDEQGRPAITFNRVLPIIKSVVGLEINSRQETVYLPRNTEPGQIRANEILTAASQWMSDNTDAEDAQTEAFFDACVCGMGWTGFDVRFDEEPDGLYYEERVNPLEMVWDHTAKEKNLIDARRIFRAYELKLSEVKRLFPKEHEDDLDAIWVHDLVDFGSDPKPIEVRRMKLDDAKGLDPDHTVFIIHAQWIEREEMYRVETENGLQTISKADWELYKAAAENDPELSLDHIIVQKKIYKQAWLGNKLLGKVKDNLCKTGFTYNCITGTPNRTKRTWFGLVEVMRDPQMMANKWLSQTLHILNTTAKGGILAEQDAFEDIRAAENTYAQPDAITWVKRGAIQNKKITQKPGVGLPTGYSQLLQYAVDSIPQVTGINMELLGMRSANQPGVLEAHRKQSAMTILAPLMDSRRRFNKMVGRCRLDLIQRFFSDGRLIRIAGQEGVQELRPLLKQDTIGDYEVIVAEAPTSPNTKEQTWYVIQQTLPAFKELLTPEAVLTIMEYSPLPQKLIGAFRDMMSKPPSPEAIEAQQIAKREKLVEIAGNEAKAKKDDAMADATRVRAITDLIGAGVKVGEMEVNAAEQLAVETLVSKANKKLPTESEKEYHVEPMEGDMGIVDMLPNLADIQKPEGNNGQQ